MKHEAACLTLECDTRILKLRWWLLFFLMPPSFANGITNTDEGSSPRSVAEATRRSGNPCVSVKYGNHEGIFLVDTGAEGIMVSGPDTLVKTPDKEWRIEKVATTPAFGPSQTMTIIHNVPVSALGVMIDDSSLCYEPLFYEPGRFAGGVAGILGLPHLHSIRLHVNTLQRRCEIASVANSVPDAAAVLKIEKCSGTFKWIKAELPLLGQERLIVDTGSNDCLLLQPQFIALCQRLGIIKPAGTVLRGSVTTTSAEVRQYVIQSLTIDQFTFVDIPVIEANYRAIGMPCLSHFDMVFDFPNETLELRPLVKDWPVRIAPDASGMLTAYFDDNVLKVVRLESDRAAMKAGLQLEDQILTLDGQEPKDLSMHRILARLRQGGTTLPLRIRRGERDFNVSLKLDWPFEYPPKWPERNTQVEEFESFLREKQKK